MTYMVISTYASIEYCYYIAEIYIDRQDRGFMLGVVERKVLIKNEYFTTCKRY